MAKQTTPARNADRLVDALEACIAYAPEEERSALAQALEDYAANHARSCRTIFLRGGLVGRIWDAMVGCTDARPVVS